VNSVAVLERVKTGYVYRERIELPVGRLDNFEGVAAEPLPRGGSRLWLITDDNLQRPMRTLLIALDLRPKLPEQRRPS
jgi:hypothetical protein